MTPLNAEYWQERYETQDSPWDLGKPSRPLTEFIDDLADKNLRILIPGGGKGYELDYLYRKGFTQAFLLDFAPHSLENVRAKFPDIPADRLILDDFFAHQGQYDLILEQTFFCALSPDLRDAYAQKMYELLKPGGLLAGVWFHFPLTEQGPPFGGSPEEYARRFSPYFENISISPCHNSEPSRQGKEVFVTAVKPFSKN